jgi:uncharacterized membrane protein
MKKQNKALFIAQAALIAAVYVVLTYLSSLFGLASGAIQVRLSEALTILPYFTPAAIPGLFVGCLLANLLTGCAPWDVVFGSIATLLPPIISNMLIVPWVLRFVYEVPDAIPFLMLTVGIGEVIACGIIGMILFLALEKRAKQIFQTA